MESKYSMFIVAYKQLFSVPQIQPATSHFNSKDGAVSVHAMKAHRGVELHCHAFLTSAVNGGDLLSSFPVGGPQ